MRLRPVVATACMLALFGAAARAMGMGWTTTALMVAGVLAFAGAVSRAYGKFWEGWDDWE